MPKLSVKMNISTITMAAELGQNDVKYAKV